MTKTLTTITAEELMALDLPPLKMIIGDAVPAGLLLLAGDPKAGKTLLLQDLAISVATGSPAWGSLPVAGGDVLYVANEGGQHSFRDRLATMLDGNPAPPNLDLAFSSEGLGGALEAQLSEWLDARPEARLVVIDTYASVAPQMRGVDRQQEDYKSLQGLADLCRSHPDLLLVVIHHTRKAEGSDVMHSISGSNGMTGATDGNAVLRRHPAAGKCVLSIRPRNAEESELTVARKPNLRWEIVGDDERATLGDTRQHILKVLELATEPVGPKQLSADTGISPTAVRKALEKMVDQHQVEKVAHGRYTLLRTLA